MTDVYDIAIIGAGPAGLSAALTGRIRSLKVALFEHIDFSRKLKRAQRWTIIWDFRIGRAKS